MSPLVAVGGHWGQLSWVASYSSSCLSFMWTTLNENPSVTTQSATGDGNSGCSSMVEFIPADGQMTAEQQRNCAARPKT